MSEALVSKPPPLHDAPPLNGFAARSSSPQPSPTRSPTKSSNSSGTTAAFVHKLHSMLEDDRNSELIRWADMGDIFFVTDPTEFSRTILPQYFKHNNWQSFVRQLNMYGFHKVNDLFHSNSPDAQNSACWEFKHPSFLRGRPELLANIKRKCPKSQSSLGMGKPSLTSAGGSLDNAQDERLDAIVKHLGELEQRYMQLRQSHENQAMQTSAWRNMSLAQQKLLSESISLLNLMCSQQANHDHIKIAQRLSHEATALQQEMTRSHVEAQPSDSYHHPNHHHHHHHHHHPHQHQHRQHHQHHFRSQGQKSISDGALSPVPLPNSARSSASYESRLVPALSGRSFSDSQVPLGHQAQHPVRPFTLPPIQYPYNSSSSSSSPSGGGGADNPGEGGGVIIRCQSPEPVGSPTMANGDVAPGQNPGIFRSGPGDSFVRTSLKALPSLAPTIGERPPYLPHPLPQPELRNDPQEEPEKKRRRSD
ncbi:uncharacterized protein VTP21DRAFT_5261 [Calcarisporiella thermophila]|uniref:uncharacterized protein n=1 Tax=Calcarisporiella thermophila TaxID=911321 RepID=UPI003743C54F